MNRRISNVLLAVGVVLLVIFFAGYSYIEFSNPDYTRARIWTIYWKELSAGAALIVITAFAQGYFSNKRD